MRSASVVEEGDENEPWWVPRDEDSNVITVEESVAEAVHALESETQLALDLGYRRLGAAGLARFSKQLNLNKSLTRIDLSCNLLQDSGAVIFFGAIAKLTAVQKVNLAGNMIGPPGAKALAECLMVNKTLEKLSLFHNEIGNAGAVAVAEALTVNRTLHSLNLRENKITNQGVSALVKSVEKDVNPTLMVLWLRNNVAHPAPHEGLVEPVPESLRGKLSLLSQEEGLFYNKISAELLNELKKHLIEKNRPAAEAEGSGKGRKEPKKAKSSAEADRSFWTPPSTPEPPEVDEAAKDATKKAKKR